jgi:hypothetical protein
VFGVAGAALTPPESDLLNIGSHFSYCNLAIAGLSVADVIFLFAFGLLPVNLWLYGSKEY